MTGRGARPAVRWLVTVVIAVLVVAVGATAWEVLVPRTGLVSLGDGTGMPEPGQAEALPGQLAAMLALVVVASAVVATLVWRRHPALRGPGGVLVAGAWTVGVVALVTTVVGAISDHLDAPDPHAAKGVLVELPATIPPPFGGPVFAGRPGLDWSSLPAMTGWCIVSGAVAFTLLAVFAWVDLVRAHRAETSASGDGDVAGGDYAAPDGGRSAAN